MKITGNKIGVNLFLLLNLVIISNLSFAGYSSNICRSIDLSKFTVSDDIPTSWMLAHTAYKDNRILTGRTDLSEEIINRELQNVWIWSAKVFCRDFSTSGKNIFFVSGIGEYNDDAGVFKWSYNKEYPNYPHYDPAENYDIELIDSRIITYLVRHNKFSEMDILDIFKDVVNYYGTNKHHVKVNLLETHELKDGSFYGKIKVEYDTAGWFDAPLEWYRKDDYVLFVFEKVVTLPKSKIAPKYNPENNPVGGIPVNDPRSFKRFDNPNCEQLTEEYFHKYFPPEILQELYVIRGKPGELMGVFQPLETTPK